MDRRQAQVLMQACRYCCQQAADGQHQLPPAYVQSACSPGRDKIRWRPEKRTEGFNNLAKTLGIYVAHGAVADETAIAGALIIELQQEDYINQFTSSLPASLAHESQDD